MDRGGVEDKRLDSEHILKGDLVWSANELDLKCERKWTVTARILSGVTGSTFLLFAEIGKPREWTNLRPEHNKFCLITWKFENFLWYPSGGVVLNST